MSELPSPTRPGGDRRGQPPRGRAAESGGEGRRTARKRASQDSREEAAQCRRTTARRRAGPERGPPTDTENSEVRRVDSRLRAPRSGEDAAAARSDRKTEPHHRRKGSRFRETGHLDRDFSRGVFAGMLRCPVRFSVVPLPRHEQHTEHHDHHSNPCLTGPDQAGGGR